MTGAGAGVTRTGTAGATLWAAVFDVSRHTFRSEICPSYKANRKETPPELASQFGLIRDACTAFGCAVKEVPNFEADDVIASYAAQAQAQGISAVIVSSDKDFMQLYRPGVEIFDPLKSAWITESHIYQKFGVKPNRVVDVQSLAGDPTDGVVGVPGIGIKTAAELINQFGSLDVLLANLHTISQRKRKELMLQHVPDIRKAKELVTLREDVPVVINEDELRVHKKFTLDEVNNISAFYKKHGFSQNV
jgi:DNA polymerase-1